MPGTVQSIERAATLLHAIAQSGGQMGVTELAGAVDLPKTTTHGLLRTLLSVGFVEQDPRTGRYSLGAGLLGLGTHYLDANELRSRASNWADSLAARSGFAVRLGTPAGLQVVVVHHVFRPDDSPQEMEVGALLPAHATAVGKVLLASRPAVARSLTDVPLDALTPRTVVDPAALLAELQATRARGWAEQRGEYRLGVAGIAAPVHGPGGLVVGALGISGPVEELDAPGARGELRAMVVAAAASVTRELLT
ncbi:IclR family transcriptional regulator [Geodermatophilus sp. DSM 45219]|uniref:IclR family transcriptional regulator n=1 Tax=Geodermatophilus sp. DSM 45219 TaxID=1881103 RepID=UPI0008868251|nr:IclR family transcriptional regulator [Geodermatophilus sp. DSM 45219]SDO02919.1 transcriptional regulator, IclR family [Geodermatophilus sp. DSM 45219]